MKKLKKYLFFTTVCMMFVSSHAVITVAETTPNIIQTSLDNEKITPYAESTIYRYQIIDGILYKRLWSVGVWIDPIWIKA